MITIAELVNDEAADRGADDAAMEARIAELLEEAA